MGHPLKMILFHIRNPIWTLNRVFVLGKMSGFERESVLYICSHCKTLGHCWSTSAFVNRAVDWPHDGCGAECWVVFTVQRTRRDVTTLTTMLSCCMLKMTTTATTLACTTGPPAGCPSSYSLHWRGAVELRRHTVTSRGTARRQSIWVARSHQLAGRGNDSSPRSCPTCRQSVDTHLMLTTPWPLCRRTRADRSLTTQRRVNQWDPPHHQTYTATTTTITSTVRDRPVSSHVTHCLLSTSSLHLLWDCTVYNWPLTSRCRGQGESLADWRRWPHHLSTSVTDTCQWRQLSVIFSSSIFIIVVTVMSTLSRPATPHTTSPMLHTPSRHSSALFDSLPEMTSTWRHRRWRFLTWCTTCSHRPRASSPLVCLTYLLIIYIATF